MLLAQRDTTGALREYQVADAIAERQAAKDSTNADRQNDLAISKVKVGDAMLAQRNKAGALTEYRAALAIAQRFQAKDPDNAEWHQLATGIASKVATCCKGTPRP